MTDYDDDLEPTTLQTRLWSAIPDLPPHERAKAESIAGSGSAARDTESAARPS